MPLRSLVLGLLALLGGCAGGVRLGAGPTLDSDGHAGAGVTVGGYFGIGADDKVGFAPVLDLGAGGQFNPGALTLDLGIGWDVLKVEESELAWRFGVRMSGNWNFDEGTAQRVGIQGVVAGSFGRMRRYRLSVELRGGVRFNEEFFDSRALGVVALNVVYDRLWTWSLWN